ncbi:PREDICTED: uncharacterized protein LOC105153320 [Acromyrmex echinatior]|uniref:uncharacterized protein LOC105153320 n=1 Tax=Acromyrmex echinatior TaxID=103372 RepID=UPI000580C1E0|nr:PREDICTED: uncharacterized protein LOC105153320 [Acromyrmex echinatior]
MSPRSLHRKNSRLCEHSTDYIAEKWEETREISDEGCILVCVRVVIVVKRQSEEKQEQRALPRRRSVPGVPLSTGEQSSVGARTKRMTLVRIARISVVLVVSLLLLLLLIVDGSWAQAYPREIKPGCRYEGRRYQEGTAVSTSEPCLQCWCTEGALRCRLRVCPRLPNPPPSGCHVRSPAENVCCAEMVCGESRDVENMLRRASVQTNIEAEDEEKHAQNSRTEGCLHDGIQYGSGSAMMGSRRCEYCYCISGTRRCLRPKCLLPLPGCTPLYVAYNCTHHHPSTMAPVSGNGEFKLLSFTS